VRNWLFNPRWSWQWYAYRAAGSLGAIAALLLYMHGSHDGSRSVLAALLALFVGLALLGFARVYQVLRRDYSGPRDRV
jgi:hypothetical protein